MNTFTKVCFWILLIILSKTFITLLILTCIAPNNNLGFLIGSLALAGLIYLVIKKLFPN